MGRLVELQVEEESFYSSIYHFLGDHPEGLDVLVKLYKIPKEDLKGEIEGGCGDEFDIIEYIASDVDAIQDIVEQSWEGTYQVYYVEESKYENDGIAVDKVSNSNILVDLNPHTRKEIKEYYENEIREATSETPPYMVDFWRNLVEALEE